MKLLSVLILLASICGVLVKSQQFANFLPYINEFCYGESQGIGYSIPLEQCVTLGASPFNSWIISESFGQITAKQYHDEFNCKNNIKSQITLTNSTCIETPLFMEFDNFTVSGISVSYSQFTITDSPIYAPKSQIQSSFSLASHGDCENGNLLFSVTFSQNLQLDYQDDTSDTYYCSNSVAYQDHCFQGTTKCGTEDISVNCGAQRGDQIITCN